jgi:integrase
MTENRNQNRNRTAAKQRVNFTPGRVADFTCPPDKEFDILWDAMVPGLGLRATSKGRKTFVFQDRLAGIRDDGTGELKEGSLRITIGPVGAVLLDKARELAREYAARVARGVDPRREKKDRAKARVEAKRAELRKAVTFGDAWPAYIESNQKKWSARHLADHHTMVDPGGRKAKRRPRGTKILPGPLSGFMGMKLADIDAEAVKAWLEKETATRPTRARLAFALLRSFLNWCADHPDYKDAAMPDACGRRIKRDHLPAPKARDDCLQREQLKGWFAEVLKIQNRVASAYLQALLLTGARRNELAALRWDDVDFQWRSMRIHDKVEGERTIPLTPYLATLLYGLPRKNDFVFGSMAAKSGHLEDPRRLHTAACRDAGIEGLTIHGLRRSFGTLAEWVEVPAGISAQLMGHKPSALAEKHYRRRPLDLLRLWHSKIEGWILEQAGIAQPGEDEALEPLRVVK